MPRWRHGFATTAPDLIRRPRHRGRWNPPYLGSRSKSSCSFGDQLFGKIRIGLEKRLRVGEVLKPLRASARGIGARAYFFVEEIDDPNDPEHDALQQDLVGCRHRDTDRRIIRELHGRAIVGGPVLGMLETPTRPETRRSERGSGNRLSIQNRNVDIQRRTGLTMVDLNSQAPDDRVDNALLRQNAAETQKRRLPSSLKPAPLAIQQESCLQPGNDFAHTKWRTPRACVRLGLATSSPAPDPYTPFPWTPPYSIRLEGSPQLSAWSSLRRCGIRSIRRPFLKFPRRPKSERSLMPAWRTSKLIPATSARGPRSGLASKRAIVDPLPKRLPQALQLRRGQPRRGRLQHPHKMVHLVRHGREAHVPPGPDRACQELSLRIE